MRGSAAGRFGNMLQLLGAVQAEGFSFPRMRWFIPAATWFVAVPVWIATHDQGCGVLHSCEAPPGQAVPVLTAYWGLQPAASSSLSCERFGSQSSDWFWLPLTTRIETGGSFTLCASARLPCTPIRTTRLCVQLVLPPPHIWNELAQKAPFSQIWASLIGPERVSVALKDRCTTPNVPVHL